ncbi:MAG: DNA polymerase III subunit gamma/tau [Clostridiales bacterium]|nr:DNA polymerase III subunit gamma/tau [Clostridiales bacterium]
MYQALYRKWRPKTFSEVVGQENVTDTLKAQVKAGRLSHAYIFFGARGTGKTTSARILARAANCESPKSGNPCNECPSCRGILSEGILDVIEIDAASNNSVDYVRELREEAVYSPASVKKRVYIIDEVHMFSGNAFNAFLKILEEPPEHVIFILATTEIHKVPVTILSRCQRFRFKRLTVSDIKDRLVFIARAEEIDIEDNAAEYIASLSDGGLRDAVSLLEQCISYRQKGVITVDTVEEVVGLAGTAAMLKMLEAAAKHDTKTALEVLNGIYTDGRNLISVLGEASAVLRDILIIKTAQDTDVPRISGRYQKSELVGLSELFDVSSLISCIETIQNTLSTISGSGNRRIDAELCIIRLCGSVKSGDYIALSDKISALENMLSDAHAKTVYEKKPDTKQTGIVPDIKQTEKNPETKTDEAAPQKPVEKKSGGRKKTEDEKQDTITKTPVNADGLDAEKLWKDIIKTAKSELMPGVAEIIKDLKPAYSDNTLWLYTDNQFTLNMLKKRENLDALHKHAEEILGAKILIRPGEPEERQDVPSELEELCQNLQGIPDIIIKP